MKTLHTCLLTLPLALVLLVMPSLSRGSQDPSAARKAAVDEPDVSQAQRSSLTGSLLASVQRNPKFIAALKVLDEQGEMVDLKAGIVLTTPQSADAREIVFLVINKQTRKPGEYGKLVYEELRGQEPIVFFEERNPAKPTPQGTQNQPLGLFGCGSWGPWNITGTKCDNRFFCFAKNQKGTFQTLQRSRQCKKGTQVDNKTVFLYCGC